MKLPIIILLALFSVGCAVQYTAPMAGPTAIIRYVNDGQRTLDISYYETSLGCKGRRFTPKILPTTEAAHTVYANNELSFQYYLTNYNGGGVERYCLLNLRFKPIKNHEYTFVTSEDLHSCKWQMFDSTYKGILVPTKLEVLEWKRGFSENSSFCNE
jgi:hypothetical protein